MSAYATQGGHNKYRYTKKPQHVTSDMFDETSHLVAAPHGFARGTAFQAYRAGFLWAGPGKVLGQTKYHQNRKPFKGFQVTGQEFYGAREGTCRKNYLVNREHETASLSSITATLHVMIYTILFIITHDNGRTSVLTCNATNRHNTQDDKVPLTGKGGFVPCCLNICLKHISAETEVPKTLPLNERRHHNILQNQMTNCTLGSHSNRTHGLEQRPSVTAQVEWRWLGHYRP